MIVLDDDWPANMPPLRISGRRRGSHGFRVDLSVDEGGDFEVGLVWLSDATDVADRTDSHDADLPDLDYRNFPPGEDSRSGTSYGAGSADRTELSVAPIHGGLFSKPVLQACSRRDLQSQRLVCHLDQPLRSIPHRVTEARLCSPEP